MLSTNQVNPSIFLLPQYTFGISNKPDKIKTVIINSDEASVKDSLKFIAFLKDEIKKLSDSKITVTDAKNTLKHAEDAHENLRGFFDMISRCALKEETILESNAEKLIGNINKASDLISYIKDYMNEVIKVYYIRKRSRASNKKYTFKELEKALKIA